MAYVIPPLLKSILAEATAIAPNRSKKSDGTIGDLAHQERKSDHNPDENRIVHAVDVTHDPAGGFDSYHYAEVVRLKCQAGRETRVKYLVTYDPALLTDVLASPKSGWQWRKHTTGRAHANHLHISILSGEKVETSTAPMFVDPVVRPPVVAPIPPVPEPEPEALNVFSFTDAKNPDKTWLCFADGTRDAIDYDHAGELRAAGIAPYKDKIDGPLRDALLKHYVVRNG